jgi:hypothetical protein
MVTRPSTLPPQPRSAMALLERARRRREQRGAAVFVIVMVITLLSALGIWAARSATMVDVATGHSRQALQVQYLADMGLQTTTAFMANGLANEFVRLGRLGAERCTQGLDPTVFMRTPFCYPFFSNDLNGAFAQSLLVMNATAHGQNSLGHLGKDYLGSNVGNLRGDFVVEMTDIGPAPPCRGCELDDVNTTVKQASVILTAIAAVHPDGVLAGNACTELGSSTAGRQMMRGHAVIGPIFQ